MYINLQTFTKLTDLKGTKYETKYPLTNGQKVENYQKNEKKCLHFEKFGVTLIKITDNDKLEEWA